MAYTWSCAECDHLDKTRKEWNDKHFCYRYGCNARKPDGYICFWLVDGRKDRELKEGGCSDHRHTEVNEQLCLF